MDEEEEGVLDSTVTTVTTVMKGIQIKRTTTIPKKILATTVLLFIFDFLVLGFVLQQQQQVPVEHNA